MFTSAPRNRQTQPAHQTNFRKSADPIARDMAGKIFRLVRARGLEAVTNADIAEQGFTPSQIAAHGDDARAIAGRRLAEIDG